MLATLNRTVSSYKRQREIERGPIRPGMLLNNTVAYKECPKPVSKADDKWVGGWGEELLAACNLHVSHNAHMAFSHHPTRA
jgi:hypothetical protein